jgi:hypothetical protein
MRILFDNGTPKSIARSLADMKFPMRVKLAGTNWKTAS